MISQSDQSKFGRLSQLYVLCWNSGNKDKGYRRSAQATVSRHTTRHLDIASRKEAAGLTLVHTTLIL